MTRVYRQKPQWLRFVLYKESKHQTFDNLKLKGQQRERGRKTERERGWAVGRRHCVSIHFVVCFSRPNNTVQSKKTTKFLNLVIECWTKHCMVRDRCEKIDKQDEDCTHNSFLLSSKIYSRVYNKFPAIDQCCLSWLHWFNRVKAIQPNIHINKYIEVHQLKPIKSDTLCENQNKTKQNKTNKSFIWQF